MFPFYRMRCEKIRHCVCLLKLFRHHSKHLLKTCIKTSTQSDICNYFTLKAIFCMIGLMSLTQFSWHLPHLISLGVQVRCGGSLACKTHLKSRSFYIFRKVNRDSTSTWHPKLFPNKVMKILSPTN